MAEMLELNAALITAYIKVNPSALTSILSTSPALAGGTTILVPSDAAITSGGISLNTLSPDQLSPILSYHVVAAPIISTNFSQPGGITVPTLLKGQLYNNRSSGALLEGQFGKNAADGQVLYFSADSIAPTTKKMRVRVRIRQAEKGGIANVRAGQGETANVDVVDGTWDGGRFQIVDSILKPPATCSSTIRPISQLSALDAALNKTQLWDTLNTTPNVTCLAPNIRAFAAAGNPQESLTQDQLMQALTFHTLPMPLYSNFITDGMEINSLGRLAVKMTVNSSGTYFNDARVLAANVLTNNGVIHILDKVMSPLSTNSTSTNGTGSPTSSGSATPASTSTGAGSVFRSGNGYAVALMTLLGIAVPLI